MTTLNLLRRRLTASALSQLRLDIHVLAAQIQHVTISATIPDLVEVLKVKTAELNTLKKRLEQHASASAIINEKDGTYRVRPKDHICARGGVTLYPSKVYTATLLGDTVFVIQIHPVISVHALVNSFVFAS